LQAARGMAKRLKLSRETVRVIRPSTLSDAKGGMINVPTKTCNCTIIKDSVLNSCYQTDCCLSNLPTLC
jgi:hypothetical protein